MQATITAKALAALKLPGLPKTERGIGLRAEKERWKSVWQKCRGPARRAYLIDLLPEEIRIALARASVSTSPPLLIGGARAGAVRGQEITEEQAVMRTQQQIDKEKALAAFNALPEEKRNEAEARLEILRTREGFVKATAMPLKRGTILFCNEFTRGNIKLPDWIIQAASRRKELKLSWSSLNRWQQAYDFYGLPGLVNDYKAVNKGATQLTDSQQELIISVLYDYPHAGTTKIMQALETRSVGFYVPQNNVVSRFVAAWKERHKDLFLYISNPDVFRNKKQFAMGDASEQIERLNQQWEFDSTPADIMLIDGRHTLIGVVDVFTRRAKLLVSPSSKAVSVAALTRRSILDWGVPEVAKTDNGSDYVSRHMVRVFEGLGIEQKLCPPFTPEAKPHIERFFHTFLHDIVEFMPGYIGHNVAQRKDIEARRSFADRLMKKGAEVELKMTSEELQVVCDRWCNAMYHQNPHSSLGGRTPTEVARAWPHPIRRITDERALDILLSEAPGDGGIRTVSKKGIKVDNVHYIAPEIAALNVGSKVRVLLDATDYGTIHLFHAEGDQVGEFICSAVDPIRTGHDRAEIAAKAKAIQSEIMREGRKELKKLSREQATREIHEEILVHRESLIANVVEFPKRSEEHTTPALEEAGFAAQAFINRTTPQKPVEMSDEEFEKSEQVLDALEKKSGIKMAMPANEWEAFELLQGEQESGLELSDKEHRWMAEYELFTRTGKKTGLVKDGWQPYAERARIAKEN